jgi:hypothetical protein
VVQERTRERETEEQQRERQVGGDEALHRRTVVKEEEGRTNVPADSGKRKSDGFRAA